MRPDAASAGTALSAPVEICSGDLPGPVARAAAASGVAVWRAGVGPTAKVARIETLKRNGAKPLMVGDGLNDAAAVAAAHASIAPASAAAVSQTAADAVFQGADLRAAPMTAAVARRAARIVRGNFALAIAYNLVAVPIAVAGFMTPLIAAIAMSSSSLLVTLNALRLRRARPLRETPAWR